MGSLQCLQTSRKALYRVFISPLERHEASLQRQLLPLLHGRAIQATRMPTPFLYQSRSYALPARSRPARGPRDFRGPHERGDEVINPYSTLEDYQKTDRSRLPQDYEITDPKIMVLNNGNFEGPLPTQTALKRLGEDESLRMFQAWSPGDPKKGTPVSYAICKVVNKREEYARQREVKERKRVSKATESRQKELEMNWGIGENDLNNKLKQLEGFLSKGWKVDLIFGKKKRGRDVEEQEILDMLNKVKKWVKDEGVREYREMEGEVGKRMKIHLVK